MRQRVRAVIGAGAIAAALGLLAGPASAHSGFTLPAASLTTAAPVLDGVMNPGEWASASTFVFPAGEAEGRVWAMHDGNYVYFAFRRIDTAPGTSAAFQVYFDNAHNGALDSGDDAPEALIAVPRIETLERQSNKPLQLLVRRLRSKISSYNSGLTDS